MDAPFYIGQEIVAIKTHPQGLFKKGEDYTVLALKEGCCEWCLLISSVNTELWTRCTSCGTITSVNAYWHGCSDFAPKQEISNMDFESAIELVTNKQPQLI